MSRAEQSFSRSVKISIALHVVVLVAFNLKLKLFSEADFKIPPSIRVDMVALPEKQVERKSKPKKTSAPKVVLKNKEKPKKNKKKNKKNNKKAELKKIKNKQKNAIEKLKEREKALSSIEKFKNDAKKTKADQDKLIKGNQISKGTSLSGLDKIHFDAYYDKIKLHLYDNWKLPQWLADSELKAQALVVIDEKGYVVRKELLSSSRNEIFDSSVLAAIDQASPFPMPPDRMRGIIPTKELIFGFPEN